MGRVVERISMGLGGAEANGSSQNAVMSEDGRYVVFESNASNLVAGDTNGVADIFRYDTRTGDIVRVSVGDGGVESNSASINASVTADGRYVVFESLADNLVAGDTNGLRDVFMRDLDTGVTTRISERPGIGEAEGGSYGSHNATIMTGGGHTWVAFVSDATNLGGGDTNNTSDIYIKVIGDGTVYYVSGTNGGAQSQDFSGPYVSMDYFTIPLVLFASQAVLTSNAGSFDGGPLPSFPSGYPDIASTEAFKLYITDGQNTQLISLDTGGSFSANGHSFEPSLKYPYVLYTSTADNPGGGFDTNNVSDVYLYNHQTQTSALVSVGLDGYAANGASGFYGHVLIAADNTPWVTFASEASNLVAGDTNGQIDFFVKNMMTGEIIRLSDPGNGVEANGTSNGFATGGTNFSVNGKTYVFMSNATNMVAGDTNGFSDIFRVVLETQDPVVTASVGTTTVTEQVAGVIDAGLTVTDADSARPTQATVRITGNYVQGQDFLQFATIGTITGTFNAATGTLTLSGWGNMAEYEAALRTVTYLNNSDAPTGDRTISFAVDDGVAWSAAGTRTVSIAPVNDGPTGIVLAGSSVQEFRPTNTVVGTLSTVDPDAGGTFTYELLTNAGGRFVLVGNQIRVADGLLLDFEQQASHQVRIRVTDNGGLTRTETITIAVTDVNPEAVTGNDEANTLVGGSGNDTLLGLGGIDTLIGNAGNDTLDGGADTVLDVLIGGLGNDTYVLGAGTNDVVVETDGNANGIDTVTSTITRTLTGQLAGMENLTLLGGAAPSNGTGNGMINVITGNEGINVLDGGALGDTLNGNGGNDVFLYASQADFAGDTVNGGAGLDRIRFTSALANETLVLSNKVTLVEVAEITTAAGLSTGTTALNLNAAAVAAAMQLIGNNGANTILGTRFADTITGNAGNDTLDGGADTVADTLTGGLGNDIYVLGAGTNDIVVETGGNSNGIDTVTSTITRALTGQLASLENLTLLGGTAAINGTGNGMINVLTGNEGINVLDGGALGDTLNGNGGNDVFLHASQADFAGDTVNGGTGVDRIRFTSALANETLVLSNKVTLVEVAEIANASGVTSGTVALNLNAAAVTAAMQLIGNNGANTIVGTSFADTITGNAGNDTLTGGLGLDKLSGGDGNDIFLIGAATEHGATETIDGGTGTLDRIRFSSAVAGQTLTLSNKVTLVEVAEITTAAGLATGTTALNLNALAVTAGMQLTGNNGINTIQGTNFADTITGNAGNDTLRGMGGLDTIIGGVGNDQVFGGLGNDKLDGGAGLDNFYFDTALGKTSNVDTISGFVVADDTIRLENAIFTALPTGTLAFGAFAKNLTGVATQADDRIIYETDTGKLFYDANGVGGAAGIHFATVAANLVLTNADFIVY